MIVEQATFEQAQPIMKVRAHKNKGSTRTRRATHPYALRRMMRCGLCNRKMQANRRDGTTYYRCKYAEEYALANHVQHPRNVYVREDEVVRGLDRWISRQLAPHRLKETIGELHQAQRDPSHVHAVELAQATIAECQAKLQRHRAAIEAGMDPVLVTS
ncbi:zinc ribbon domain-containing protein [Spirillospora sp. CA-253888]